MGERPGRLGRAILSRPVLFLTGTLVVLGVMTLGQILQYALTGPRVRPHRAGLWWGLLGASVLYSVVTVGLAEALQGRRKRSPEELLVTRWVIAIMPPVAGVVCAAEGLPLWLPAPLFAVTAVLLAWSLRRARRVTGQPGGGRVGESKP